MFGGFPEESHPLSEQEGYEIQALLHELLEGAGHGTVTGHKIGCTTPTMQAYLNIPRPAGGGVFDSTVQHVDGRFRHADFIRPGVECELAVRLGRDLDARSAPFDRSEIAAAVDSVMAAIEIVDDRYVDWGSLGAIQLIADDFFGAGCVLGAERELGQEELDLTAVSARMTINGVEVGAGVGADILGDPLTALMWLVNEMARYGHSFRRRLVRAPRQPGADTLGRAERRRGGRERPAREGDGSIRLGGLVGEGLGGLLHDPVELVGERNAGRDGPSGVDAVRPGGDDPPGRPDPGSSRAARAAGRAPLVGGTPPSLRSTRPCSERTPTGRHPAARRSPRAARSSLRRPFAHR